MNDELRAEFRFLRLTDEGDASINLFLPPDEWREFIMTKEDIESNMLKFGRHPELLRALSAQGVNERLSTSNVDVN